MRSFLTYLKEAVSSKVLEHFRGKAVDHYNRLYNGGPGNKTECIGTCGAASWALHNHLVNQGKDSHFVLGSYSKYGDAGAVPFDPFDCHCWVEHDDKILDVTHGQFDPKHPVVATGLHDPRYKAHKRDAAAFTAIQHWSSNIKASNANAKKYYSGLLPTEQ